MTRQQVLQIRQLLEPLRGKDAPFLLEQFCTGIAGKRLVVDTLLAKHEQDLIFAELSRKEEAKVVYSSKERLTWRSEHLSPERRMDIARARVDEIVLKRLKQTDGNSAVPIWPDGHPFALCITHDVDHVSANNWREGWRAWSGQKGAAHETPEQNKMTVMRATRFSASSLIRKHVLHSKDRLADFAAWMKIEDSLGFRSTFYFFAGGAGAWHPWDCAYRLSDRVPFDGRAVPVQHLMKELVRSGWEIGLHPGYLTATNGNWLRGQKEICEEAIGTELASVRQHTLQYSITRTPAIHAEAGLSVDSTHGFNDLIGFRAGTSFPYLAWDWEQNATLPVLELPLHIQDGPLMRAASSIDGAIADALRVMDSVQQMSGCLVILWHPHWLATDSGLTVFKTILEEAKRRNAWGCTAEQAANWWLGRTQAIMKDEARFTLAN